MRCGQLVSIDLDVAMANNISQAVFITNRKTFLNEEITCFSVTFVFLSQVSVCVLVLIILCLVSELP